LAELSFAGITALHMASARTSLSNSALVVDHANAVNMGWPDAYS
jgi:hypothetical protein